MLSIDDVNELPKNEKLWKDSSRSGEVARKVTQNESVDGGIGFPAALIQLVNCFFQPAQTLFVFRANDLLKNLDQFVEKFDRLSPQDWALHHPPYITEREQNAHHFETFQI